MKTGKYQGCILEETCSCCPEQYNISFDGHYIGYIRLRHGYLAVDYVGPNNNYCDEVYATDKFRGDGMFEDDDERQQHLKIAIELLKARYFEATETKNTGYDDIEWT